MFLDVHCRLCSLAMYLVPCKPSACCHLSSSLTPWSQDGSYSFSCHSHITVSTTGREVRKQKEPLSKPFEYTAFQEGLDYEVYLPMRSLFVLLYVVTHQRSLFCIIVNLEICSLKINERPRTEAAMITLDQLTVMFWVGGKFYSRRI